MTPTLVPAAPSMPLVSSVPSVLSVPSVVALAVVVLHGDMEGITQVGEANWDACGMNLRFKLKRR